MRVLCSSLVLAASTLVALPAAADCRIDTLLLDGGRVSIPYDPFDTGQVRVALPIRISGSECESQRVALAVASESSQPLQAGGVVLTSGADRLAVEIVDRTGANRLKTSELDLQGNSAIGRFTGSGSALDEQTLFIQIEPGQMIGPARYLTRLLLSAQPIAETGARGAVAVTPFDVEVVVEPTLLLGAGSDTTIDLGELSSGEVSPAVRFTAYANTNYELAVRSETGFRLRRGEADTGLLYRPLIGAAEVTIGSQANERVARFTRPSAEGRRSHELQVQLAPFTRPPAGEYSDIVTVEIRSRL
jgi:hypothetical protein